MISQQEEKSTRCNGDLNCPASLTHRSNCLSRYRGTEFGKWWATKKAEGYDYGYEALENVQFGFEAGASSLAEKQKEIEKLRRALQAYVEFSHEAALKLDRDEDHKCLKLLLSMAGEAPRYRHDVDEARAALNPISEPTGE